MSFIHKIWYVSTYCYPYTQCSNLMFRIVLRRLNSLTYNALISLQARILVQLDRTWTQEPAMLEDALGRIWEFHLECIDSWEVVDIKFPWYRISS